MKNVLFFICQILLSAYTGAFAQNAINIGIVDTIESNILQEQRTIWIHTPSNYSNDQQYPVLYLLDGEAHFYATVGIVTHLSEFGNTVCPEMIVVGITNTDRISDLTPYKPNPVDPFLPPQWV